MNKTLIKCVVGACIVSLVGGGFLLINKGNKGSDIKKKESSVQEEKIIPQDVVEIDGKYYREKKNVDNYLLMGYDERSDSYSESYNGHGMTDVLQVLTIDHDSKTYSFVYINRTSMTDVDYYTEDNEFIATVQAQICLAHGFGDTYEERDERALECVSKYLKGISFDGYIGLFMDAISTLNHTVDGVTVTIEDDFSGVDPEMKLGETIRLSDEQAYTFVHDRTNLVNNTTVARGERQKVFLGAYKSECIKRIKESSSFINGVYDTLKPYMKTDMKLDKLTKVAMYLSEYEEVKAPEITGEVKYDEKETAEFYADESSLNDLVTSVFYSEWVEG